MSLKKSKASKASTNQHRVKNPLDIDQYLHLQGEKDLLQFITCGSVDDGKSTLIGRLLWESQQLFDDQISALKVDSKKHGTQGNEIDYALLVDGLAAEREQGITIDVAYRFFSTRKRKFIVADTPGHEQYTRNMVTGASHAQLAILLVDASKGLLTQTRRHAYIASLMGIKQVILAINKMDLVSYSQAAFLAITQEFEQFAKDLGFEASIAIPISALKGDNITTRSTSTPWYQGPTLLGCLETTPIPIRQDQRAVFPVQWVNRPNAAFRGYSGTLAEGSIGVHDELRVTSSGQVAKVAQIVTMDQDLPCASAGNAITLVLDREIDASRGDVLSSSQLPIQTTDQFEATLVWMNEDDGLVGRKYDLKLANQWAIASITQIKHRININTLAHEASKKLSLNDVCQCNLALNKSLAFDSYKNSPTLGGFILVDRYTHATVATGMISHNLRRSDNVHQQALSITRENREELNGHGAKVIWFTGLSGSGKSTIANALEIELHRQGKRTFILDGDNIRRGLNRDLGFTDTDRVENIRRIAEVAKLMMDAGVIVITAFISPFRSEREMARELIGKENFIEVYVDTPLNICEERDPKGLYKKARAGELPNMTGIGSPYEAPLDPQIAVNTSTFQIDDVVLELEKLIIQK